jgi:hypothetical protein
VTGGGNDNPKLSHCRPTASVTGTENMKKPMTQESEARGGEHPPAAKKGWDHSEMVLVYYAAEPEMDHTSAWSIAYYHHKPPFDQKPHWVDFSRSWGTPDYWWPLPELPNDNTHRRER